MTFIASAGAVAALAFLLIYVRPGRFGITVLALAAGSLLAGMWADDLSRLQSIHIPLIPFRTLVYGGFVLLPGIVVLLFGGSHKSILPRLFAALILALFIVLLLLPILPVAAGNDVVYTTLRQYEIYGVTVALVLGLLDVMSARMPKAPKRHSKD